MKAFIKPSARGSNQINVFYLFLIVFTIFQAQICCFHSLKQMISFSEEHWIACDLYFANFSDHFVVDLHTLPLSVFVDSIWAHFLSDSLPFYRATHFAQLSLLKVGLVANHTGW